MVASQPTFYLASSDSHSSTSRIGSRIHLRAVATLAMGPQQVITLQRRSSEHHRLILSRGTSIIASVTRITRSLLVQGHVPPISASEIAIINWGVKAALLQESIEASTLLTEVPITMQRHVRRQKRPFAMTMTWTCRPTLSCRPRIAFARTQLATLKSHHLCSKSCPSGRVSTRWT